MAARTFAEVALADMRRAGFPNPYYPDSYARNEVRPLGRSLASYSAQSDRAVLVMGRYADSRAFSAATNPDYPEISYRDAAQIADLASRTWNRILLWNHTYLTEEAGLDHVPGWIDNTRVAWWDFQVWIRYASGWVRIVRTDEWDGHPINPTFRVEDFAKVHEDARIEAAGRPAAGLRSVRLTYDPSAAYGAGYWAYHGYAGGVQSFVAADALDFLVFAKVSKIVHSASLADDRPFTRKAISIGADLYPDPLIYDYPSVGVSRHKLIRASWPEWQFVICHTMTQDQLQTIGLPASLTNLVENFDEGGSPPPVITPPGPAPIFLNSFELLVGDLLNSDAGQGAADVAPVFGGTVQLTAVIGTAFSYTHPMLVAGTPAPVFSKTAGPSWASVNSSTGAITGTPTGSPTSTTITVQATNSAGTAEIVLPLDVVAAAVAPVITTTSLPGGEEDVAYLQQIVATGTGPLTWSVTSGSAALAAIGLALSAASGVVSGTTPIAGTASITVRATGPTGLFDEQALTIEIGDAGDAPVITTTSLPDADLDEPYTASIAVTGASPRTYEVIGGALPPGIDLDPDTGDLDGAGTVAGGYPFTVQVSNGFEPPAVRQFSIRVIGASTSTAPSPWSAVLKGR